jgi:MFS family permease
MSQPSASSESSIRSLALAVYLPIIIFSVGEGAIIPFIVLGAQDLGASASLAGAIFALPGVSALAFAIPAGTLIARFGSRKSAVVAIATTLAGLVGVVVGTSVLMYAVSISVIGIGWSVWRLVRFDFVVSAIGREKRGRALSVMGGAQRIGRAIGPLLAAAVAVSMGLDGAFYLHMLVALVAIGVFVSVPITNVGGGSTRERPKLRGLAGEHRRSFGTAGVGLVILIILRSARPVVLPLWAVHIGLDPAAVGVIFGVSSAVDAALFYPAGVVMDRFGRKWAGVPAIALLAFSFFLLPLSTSFATLLGVGLLMGVGNGISSGYGATLGSDLAPEDGQAEFLGMWQMVANLGNMSGPLILGGIIAVASLGTASVTIGVIGAVGLAQMAFLVPETLVRSKI